MIRQNVTRQNVTRQIVTRQNVAEPPYQVGKDIGIKKSEFVANTQLFFMLSLG